MSLQLSSVRGLGSTSALCQQRNGRVRIGVRTAPQKTSIVCSDSSAERLCCSSTASECSSSAATPAMAKAKCVHPARPLAQACADCPRRQGKALLMAAAASAAIAATPAMTKAKCIHPARPASQACADCPRKGRPAVSAAMPAMAKAKCVHPAQPISQTCADCPRKARATAPAMAKAKCVHPTRPISQACADCPRRQGKLAAAAAAAGRLGCPLALAGAAALAASLLLLPPAAVAATGADAAAGAAVGGSGGLLGMAQAALSFVLHLDAHLVDIVARHGAATYAILFAIVFAETGLVVTPFLPGDSLLFATGALAGLGKLSLPTLAAVYITAATLGDALNYAIGAFFGAKAVASRLVAPKHVAKTEAFFAKYGGKAVVLARFVPIVRTFAPFIAGVGSMQYSQARREGGLGGQSWQFGWAAIWFAVYNVLGAVLWTGVCCGAGVAFGNMPAVQHNFSLVVLGIVVVSLLPLAWEMRAARHEAAEAQVAHGSGEADAAGAR